MSVGPFTQLQRVIWRLMPADEKRALAVLSRLNGTPIAAAFVTCVETYGGDVHRYAVAEHMDLALEMLLREGEP